MKNRPSTSSPDSAKNLPLFRPNPHPLSFSSDSVPVENAPTEEDKELFGYLFDSKGVPLPGARVTTWEDSSEGDLETLIRSATAGLQFETETALEACASWIRTLAAAFSEANVLPNSLQLRAEEFLQQLNQLPPEPARPLVFPVNTDSPGSLPAVFSRVQSLIKLCETLRAAGFPELEPVPGLTLERLQQIAEDLAGRAEDLDELLWDQVFFSESEEE